MKRIIILFFLAAMYHNAAWCQADVSSADKRNYRYALRITNFDFAITHAEDGVCYNLVKVNAYSSDGEISIQNSDQRNIYKVNQVYFTQNEITRINIDAVSRDKTNKPFNDECNQTAGIQENIYLTSCLPGSCGYSAGISDIKNRISFDYASFPLHTLDVENIDEQSNTILPTEDRITLVAKSDFPENYYRYQYRLAGESTWNDIASNLYKLHRLTVSAKDLYGSNFINHLGKNIQFRVVSCPVGNDFLSISDTCSLTITPSAPYIESVVPTQPRCYGENNGKLTIQLSRSLYTNERLYASVEEIFKQNSATQMSSGNVMEITGLPAGNYPISLLGTYRLSASDSIHTFTQGANHTKNVTIQERPAVSLDITPNAVHCRNGMDGKIDLNVSGGNGNFTAYLLDNAVTLDTLTQMSVTTGTHTFSELYQGAYQVYVKDSNGCEYDINGEKTQKSVYITEPTDTVRISIVGFQEATGYGRSTGWAEVGAQGGSSGYTFSWEKQNPLTSMTPTNGTAITSKLENLPTGWYVARVEDQNYNSAFPRTEVNTRGCMDTVHIFINQPPKLITELEETHIVTCHGDNDGELQAHTAGGRPFNPAQDNGRTLPYDYEWFKIENNVDIPIGGNDSIVNNIYTGYYKLKVTDRNGIDTVSLVLHLVQPDTLIAKTIALQQVMCEGDSTGRAQVIVTGGTPPYTYQWTTDNNDTGTTVENLPRNIYTVFVKDSRFLSEDRHKRCTAEAHVNISSPNGVKAAANLINPTCNRYSDGKVELTVSGGTAPYRYLWENGSTARDRSNLADGEYRVSITDGNDCSISEEYTLTEPVPVIVNLGEGFTLCAEQELTVRDANEHETVSYQWTNESSNILSTESELTVSAAGTYKLTVTTPEGCLGSDEITVGQSNDMLRTDFVVASLIPRGKTIHAINIIKTDVDRVEWILPDDAFIVEKTDDKAGISFARTGEYSIGFIAYLGECRDIMYKTVKVVESWEIEEYADEEPFLKRFIVSPNPNDGNFTVYVELRELSDYQLLLFNETGVLLDSKDIRNTEGEETLFNRGDLGAGVYYLRFVAKGYVSVFKLIIR